MHRPFKFAIKIIKVIERWWKKQFVSRHGGRCMHVARDSHDPIIHAAMVEALLHCNVSFVARDGWISIRSPRSSLVSLNFLSICFDYLSSVQESGARIINDERVLG